VGRQDPGSRHPGPEGLRLLQQLSRRQSGAKRRDDAGPAARRPRMIRGPAVAVLALALSASTAPAWAVPAWAAPEPAPALRPRPWMPPGLDSMRAWSLEARTLLSQSSSDSVGAGEARAFELYDRIARRYFEALGPQGMNGARGILAVFDTLQVQSDFAQDELLPQFC